MPFVVPDAVSFAMVSLTVFIFLLSFGLLFKEVHRSLTVWCGLLFILEGFILSAFLVKNILIFYISFESVLLPMYLFIGAWGSRSRKIKANYYFFLYTLFGSLFTLLGILALYFYTGALSYNLLAFTFNEIATIPNMRSYPLEHCIWLLLAIGFFAKFPIFVFHLWLPEAHVEAPTVGSVILAALLLKLGVYGFVRLPFTLFPVSTAFWLPIVLPFAFIGTLYPALVAIVHDDFKKIIAYSSISHMSFVLLGLLTRTFDGTAGALFLALGHGLTSGGLFVFAGLLYDRFRTRDVKYYGGVLSRMPYAGFSFVLLILGNTGFPFFCNFPGELLVFAGSIQCFGLVSGVLFFGFILTAIYSFRLVNLFFFGAPKPQVHNSLYDLTRSEFAILSVFNAAIVVLGLFCAPLLHLFEENLIWVL
jgi:proton-translocating NADH-quinone oxidoreductase chain M